MTDYKRLVSYMYQYESGIKRKNVGFARVEAKGGQCKITLHMQLLGQLDSIFPTYLIQRGNNSVELIYLGDTILKNQVMDSRLSADEDNIMDSGFGLSEMSGILLFLNDKIFYATVWDDKPIISNEVLEALRPRNNRQQVKREELSAKSKAVVAENDQENITKTFFEKTPVKIDYPPEQTSQELKVPNYMLPGGWKMVERLQWPIWEAEKKKEAVKDTGSEEQVTGIKESDNAAEFTEIKNPKGIISEDKGDGSVAASYRGFTRQPVWDQVTGEQFTKYQSISNQDSETQSREDTDFNSILQEENDSESREQLYKIIEELSTSEYDKVQAESQDRSANPNQTGDTFQPDQPAAKHFFDNYPRIYPFEDNEITNCVKIEPKDIGLLPKEIWPFSNNSFLMHGYYCYHHLIFAKMKNSLGYHYILGVPGIYHGREQFMARMFGFENFKSIRKRELKQGDFGYWYLPITF